MSSNTFDPYPYNYAIETDDLDEFKILLDDLLHKECMNRNESNNINNVVMTYKNYKLDFSDCLYISVNNTARDKLWVFSLPEILTLEEYFDSIVKDQNYEW